MSEAKTQAQRPTMSMYATKADYNAAMSEWRSAEGGCAMNSERPSPAEVAQFGERFAARMFAGRKGHGGGPIAQIRMTEQDLARIIAVAYDEGWRAALAGASQ